MDEMLSVVIVGAGPAGIAAAIYLQRGGFDPLLLEKGVPGGLLRHANNVENYPGFPRGISGTRLAELFVEHLWAMGGSVKNATVKCISRCEDGTFAVSTLDEEYRTKTVIIATGTRAKLVDIRGAQAVGDHRVFYDILELLDMTRPPEKILIYGGGDAAFDYGLNLDRRGYDVTILCRSRIKCLPLLRERAEHARIRAIEGHSITRVMDERRLRVETDGMGPIETDRLLIACGREPRLDILASSLIALSSTGERTHAADMPGLYLAGDIVADRRRQAGIAIGSGLNAAMLAEQYLRK